MNMKKNIFQNPSKKALILFAILSFTGISLMILAMSDLFTESVFQKRYLMFWFLIITNLMFLIRLFVNYSKNKKI
ncbi:hypothetical protein FEDK69T_04130 [Flavobacterium enshiense DK69]|uniref:Uncharacterized protein n=1 Tax=Flavobacterium enshiense DK69 TaxID=1107311 RepID=V6SKD5_9FLAO|nr:hypothetical protein FEDK69T_04130 [Flavobacterium enshiense DK69]KGO96693.1 hypothetical protein Q767_03005 [Flavobacterium enshiense DK69]